ncbi:hypothetical protein HMI54_006541 [Coelomomyces lativittatus]|nr:hypothetical protein HMI56_007054 [Coelomomyces lativittatus]KAJ1517220.1 hypothetical protein HMI54_006541 [Coelomomyces lativittatus]
MNLCAFIAFIFFLQCLCIFSLPIYQPKVVWFPVQKKFIHVSSQEWKALVKNQNRLPENPSTQKIDLSQELQLSKRNSESTSFRIDVKSEDTSPHERINLALAQGTSL